MDTREERFLRIANWFDEFVGMAQALQSDRKINQSILEAVTILSLALRRGSKILILGNGGSAADAQHFSAELIGRFRKERRALAAIALTTDTSVITSQSNDSGFETIFSRQIEGLGRLGDVVIGITTSDVSDTHSKNIENGFKAAKAQGLKTIGLFSEKTINLLPLSDVSIIVPSSDTARIQEAHATIIHLLCELIEEDIN